MYCFFFLLILSTGSTDQRIPDEREATRIPVDIVAVSVRLQGRRNAKIRERGGRRAGLAEH